MANTSETVNHFDLSAYLLDCVSTHSTASALRNAVQRDIETVKSELTRSLASVGGDSKQFQHCFHSLSQLTREIKSIEAEINKFIESDLSERVNKLKEECRIRNEAIERATHLSDFIDKLKKIDAHIESVDESYRNKSYETAVHHILSAAQLHRQLNQFYESLNIDFNNISSDVNDLIQTLKTEIIVKREELIDNLRHLFISSVKVFKDDSSKQNVFEYNFLQFMQINEYQSFVNSLIKVGEIDNLLNDLIKSLNLHFIKPILSDEINDLQLLDNSQIIARYGNNASPLKLLKNFLEFFSELISNKNTIENSKELLSRFGRLWTTDIFNQILSIYLNRLLPKKESEISSYLHIVEDAEEIRNFMIQRDIIANESVSPFIEFASNINSHFATRICKDYIIRAKRIICQDLPQTVEVGNTVPLNETQNSNNSEQYFPLCRISEFIVELIKLIQDINCVSEQCSTQCASALNDTISSICELYIDISPVYFKQMIDQFPQQNAIFHNNCFYFSHFMRSFTSKQKLENRSFKSLMDYSSILQQLGSQVFLKQMKVQEKLILSSIQSSQFFHSLNDIANENSNSYTESYNHLKISLKQPLVHLNFLKNSFTDVLPEKVYDKAMFTLINALFTELLNRTLALNDISSSGALCLSKHIEILMEDIKQLLNAKNPSANISKWFKLSELNFILKANLSDIVERWSDGKGVLAADFSAEEVKHLIRALFQNTERRSFALSKIKT